MANEDETMKSLCLRGGHNRGHDDVVFRAVLFMNKGITRVNE